MDDQTRRDETEIPRPQRRLRPAPDNDQLPPGRLSTRRFTAVMGISSAVLVFSAVSFLTLGIVAGATLGPGMGGFVAQFDNVTYTDSNAEIYPVIGAHPACDDAPQLEADLVGTTELTGDVIFFKDLPLPSNFAPDEVARISIYSTAGTNPIQVDDLNLRFTALAADRAQLGGTRVREFGPNQYGTGSSEESFAPVGNGSLNPGDPPLNIPEYGINASTFILPDGGTAAAHEVTFGSITLQDLDLAVVIDEKSQLSSPVTRVVEPNNRTCTSLADAM